MFKSGGDAFVYLPAVAQELPHIAFIELIQVAGATLVLLQEVEQVQQRNRSNQKVGRLLYEIACNGNGQFRLFNVIQRFPNGSKRHILDIKVGEDALSSNNLDVFKRFAILLGNRICGCENQNDAVFFWVSLLQELAKFSHQLPTGVGQARVLAGQRFDDFVAFSQYGIRTCKRSSVLALDDIPCIAIDGVIVLIAAVAVCALQIGDIYAAVSGAVADDKVFVLRGYAKPLGYKFRCESLSLFQPTSTGRRLLFRTAIRRKIVRS